MGEIKLLLSILMIFLINEYLVLGCAFSEKILKLNPSKDDLEKQVDLSNVQEFKREILNLMLFPKLGISGYINKLKKDCQCKNHELKLDKEMFKSRSKEERTTQKNDFMGKLKMVKDLPDFDFLPHIGKDLQLIKEFFDPMTKLGSVHKDEKSTKHDWTLKTAMFLSSPKQEKDVMEKIKVIKDLPDRGPFMHDSKDKPNETIDFTKKLISNKAFLHLIPNLEPDQKNKLQTDQENKNHGLKIEREMFKSSSKPKVITDITDFGQIGVRFIHAFFNQTPKLEPDQKAKLKRGHENINHEMFQSSYATKKYSMIDKFKFMKLITELNHKNNDKKDLETNHQYVLNNEETPEQCAEWIPVMVISPKSNYYFTEIGWKEVFGRKSQSEHHRTCYNKKTKKVEVGGKVKQMNAAFSTNSIQSDGHNEISENRECKGDDYKRIACNICQCDGSRWRCTSLACNIKRLSKNLPSLMSENSYNKLREKATGCIPGEKLNMDDNEDCPCVCALPSVVECEVCPALGLMQLPKMAATTEPPEKIPFEDLYDYDD